MIFINKKYLSENICRFTNTSFKLCVVMLFIGLLSTPVVAADLEKGEKSFIKCKVCHSVEKDVSKIGPSLHGVFGRKSGTLESFPNYSDAMKAADIVWDDKTIREFIKAPRTYVANTKMIFIGIKNDTEMDDLMAYLKSIVNTEQKKVTPQSVK